MSTPRDAPPLLIAFVFPLQLLVAVFGFLGRDVEGDLDDQLACIEREAGVREQL